MEGDIEIEGERDGDTERDGDGEMEGWRYRDGDIGMEI